MIWLLGVLVLVSVNSTRGAVQSSAGWVLLACAACWTSIGLLLAALTAFGWLMKSARTKADREIRSGARSPLGGAPDDDDS